MNLLTPHRTRGLALALAVFAIDRAVKWWLTGPMALADRGPIPVLPIYAFRYTENYGVSLGMFTATSAVMRYGLIAVTGAIAIGVLVWLLREKVWGEICGLALILGGALGNIWDRVGYGFVIDYADLHFNIWHWGEWRPFLIFNLADAAITFGVLILLARSLLLREKPAKSGPSAENA